MAKPLSHVSLFLVFTVFSLLSTAFVPAKRDSKPNVVMIVVDDQDLHMNSMDRMDNLQTQLLQQGTFFNKHYGHVSICCPARTTIWTGLHTHNTNVTTIFDGMAGGGYVQLVAKGWHKNNLGAWMQNAGYSTYYTGKFVNGYSENTYCNPECLEGFSKADVFLGGSTYHYYGTQFATFDGDNWSVFPGDNTAYSTDQVADNVANFIDESASAGNPFFAVAAPVAPHGPAIPKKEYEDLYPGLEVPKSPNFNPENRTGVNSVWNLERLQADQLAELNTGYRRRQQTLKSVDDLIDTIIKKLEDTGTLDNTYIFYTTDNGYHMGNHRLPGGKLHCFEEDINIPLIVRGPDVGKNRTSDFVTGHVDLVPTVLALGGYGEHIGSDEIGVDLDGTAITFPLQDDSDFDRNSNARGETTHLEFWGPFQAEWHVGLYGGYDLANLMTYKALRLQGPNYSLMYSVWCTQGAHELYDMSWDPYQMTNLHPDAPVEGNGTNAYNSGMNTMLGRPIDEVIHRLDAVVLVLKDCTADECRWPWRQLHPNGKVQTLTDALNEKYDQFYTHNYAVAKVGWERCYTGYQDKTRYIGHAPDSTLYDLSNEQPSWKNAANSRASSGINLTAWLVAWIAYLCFKSVVGY